MILDGDMRVSVMLDGDLAISKRLDGELGQYQKVIEANWYTGPTEWTPTAEQQIIPIEGLTAATDITINPIPNNYGLITWNGSTLTVS